jgi:hypothetical protein
MNKIELQTITKKSAPHPHNTMHTQAIVHFIVCFPDYELRYHGKAFLNIETTEDIPQHIYNILHYHTEGYRYTRFIGIISQEFSTFEGDWKNPVVEDEGAYDIYINPFTGKYILRSVQIPM